MQINLMLALLVKYIQHMEYIWALGFGWGKPQKKSLQVESVVRENVVHLFETNIQTLI